MFYILERAKCEEDTDISLDHVLDYCEKDYKKPTGVELTMNQIKKSMTIENA